MEADLSSGQLDPRTEGLTATLFVCLCFVYLFLRQGSDLSLGWLRVHYVAWASFKLVVTLLPPPLDSGWQQSH